MGPLLIYGAAGYTNLGDDAILWGMARDLDRVRGDRPLLVVGGPHLPPLAAALGARALSVSDRDEIARAVEDADLVVIGGGGLLYDVDFAPSLTRLLADPPDRYWLYEAAKLAAAARAAGHPLLLYGLGVGPLTSEAGRGVARFAAEQAQAITLRDQGSVEELAAAGVPASRLFLAADPAISVPAGDPEQAAASLEAAGFDRSHHPLIALNLRPWAPANGPAASGPAVGDLVARLGRVVRDLVDRLGASVALLPFQRLNDDDRALLSEVLHAAGDPPAARLLDLPTQPPDAVALLSHFDLMIGMRLHALLLSAAAGTPFVALPYARKVSDLVAALDWGDYAHLAESASPEAILTSAQAVLDDRDALVARLRAKCEELQARSRLSADLAGELLASGRLTSGRLAHGRVAPRPRPPVHVAAAPTRPLRVLMQIRPDYREKPGGDVVQLEELLPHLPALGIEAELTGDPEPDLSRYDLVHLLNLDRPEDPYRHALNALAQNTPIVLSPVHTDMTEFLAWGDTDYWDLPAPGDGVPRPRPAPPPDPIELRRRARSHLQRQLLVDWSTFYLPNSQLDADYLAAAYGLDLTRSLVVHHGLDASFFEAQPGPFVEKYGRQDFVLCAGRVERRKNQLSLIAALRGSGIPLVIIGQPNPPEYRDLCRRYADENTTFLDALPQHDLASAYAAAKVHALPSWFEVPGLVSLEAGAAGCNIVTTDRGSAREYLRDLAWYCDPCRVASIAEAVRAAFEAPRSPRLRDHIRQHFTWRHAAERTAEGYRQALALHEAANQPAQARECAALRQHGLFLSRLVADRAYEAQQMRQWGESAEAELMKLQAEFDRVTSRRLHRWSAAAARAAWSLLHALGVKR